MPATQKNNDNDDIVSNNKYLLNDVYVNKTRGNKARSFNKESLQDSIPSDANDADNDKTVIPNSQEQEDTISNTIEKF